MASSGATLRNASLDHANRNRGSGTRPIHRPKRSAAIATLYGENCRLLLATDGLLTRLAPYRELSTHLASTEQLPGSCAASTAQCQSRCRPHYTGGDANHGPIVARVCGAQGRNRIVSYRIEITS